MKMSESHAGLRAILDGTKCLYCPSVFDPISARIAGDMGFSVGILGGSIASLAMLGDPDCNVLTLSELVEQTRRICAATALPLVVDVDHGYGNAMNVVRAVRELEAAGAAALSLEDTQIPRAFGARGFAQISIAEMSGRLRAAIAMRRDPGLVVMARTHAASADRDAQTSRRLLAYADDGVDALCLTGVQTVEQLQRIAQGVRLPIVLITYAGNHLGPVDGLAQYGVKLCIDGHHPYLAAVQAVYDTLRALRDGVPSSALPRLATPQLLAQVSRREVWEQHERAFLGQNAR